MPRGRRVALNCATLLFPLICLAQFGCGGPFTGTVEGQVSYKGGALPGGIITFVHPDGRIGQTQIEPDGRYTVEDAPGGDVTVTVATKKPISGMGGMMMPKAMRSEKGETQYPAGKYVKIPARWGDAATSGLSFTVKRGTQTYDITITD